MTTIGGANYAGFCSDSHKFIVNAGSYMWFNARGAFCGRHLLIAIKHAFTHVLSSLIITFFISDYVHIKGKGSQMTNNSEFNVLLLIN